MTDGIIAQLDKNWEQIKMIGREAIANAILEDRPIGAHNLANLFETLDAADRIKFLELVGKETTKREEPAHTQPDMAGYTICAEMVRTMHGKLVAARIEGRWEDVIEHFYHAHYTRAYLRRTGALTHYLGEGVDQEDPQIYS
jgi:hypothetical protein